MWSRKGEGIWEAQMMRAALEACIRRKGSDASIAMQFQTKFQACESGAPRTRAPYSTFASMQPIRVFQYVFHMFQICGAIAGGALADMLPSDILHVRHLISPRWLEEM